MARVRARRRRRRSATAIRPTGPWDPAAASAATQTKLLLDPYARAITGDVTFGPAVLGHADDDPDGPSPLDSAGRCRAVVVVDPTFDWGDDAHPRHSYADTIFYELHVKGFTQLHPAVPARAARDLRRPRPRRGHRAPRRPRRDRGRAAARCTTRVPEAFLVGEGRTNYWGYNTIGYFAPHAGYSAARARRPRRAVRSTSSSRWCERLHAAGLEVILDVVFNHTAEADHPGPTLCHRGLDNPAYYRLDARRPAALRRHHRLRELAQRRATPSRCG